MIIENNSLEFESDLEKKPLRVWDEESKKS